MTKPDGCIGCPLYHISDGFSSPEGTGSNGVAIIGEALGYNEYQDGLPFRPHAQAGSKLEDAFRILTHELGRKVVRSQFLLYNLVNCHPPGDKLSGASYEEAAVHHCARHRDKVLADFAAHGGRVILALGNLAMKYLCGVSGDAKKKESISHLRGFVHESEYGLVVPSYHPSFIRRGNNHLTPLLVMDIKRALWLASGVYKSHPYHSDYVQPEYQTNPGLDEAKSFYYQVKDSSRCVLAYDIETAETAAADEDERDEIANTEITQIQFSITKGTGIAFPYTGSYKDIARDILELPNVKANHNTWNFDNPILRRKEGIKVAGLVHDTQWMWKHWSPRLPRGLQAVASYFMFPFPWKHMFGEHLQYYGCADVDAVQWILAALPKLMQQRGIWEGYRRHVLGVHPIFERAREEVGIPVNEAERQLLEIRFKKKRKEINKKLQDKIPDKLRNIKPARKDKTTGEVSYGYVREPKIVSEGISRYNELSQIVRAIGREPKLNRDEFLFEKYHLTTGDFKDSDTGETMQRWCIIEPFKASKDQLVRYLKYKQKQYNEEAQALRAKRPKGGDTELTNEIRRLEKLAADYEVPLHLKTKKETTIKDEMQEMFEKTDDVVLELVTDIRSLDTNINNYLKNWQPGADGRVRPTFGFTAPQGQINTWRPNGQNVSKHTAFGQEFRRIIEAPPGYCFVEADKKSFHVGTMGYLASDASYIRFGQLDPHSILGSYIDPSVLGQSISMKWSDSDIKLACAEFKRKCKERAMQGDIDVRQQLAKPTVLGNQLELHIKKLQWQNRKYIHYVTRSERERDKGKGLSAEELQYTIKSLFPSIARTQEAIKEKAYLDRYLIDEWGRIQYFYDIYIFTYNKHRLNWERREGDGAREPIAFRVQGTAFGMITNELLRLEELGACEEYNFLMTIHDSLIFMPEIAKRDKCIEIVRDVMSSPCKQLTNAATGPLGLRIGVEFSVGRNWKSKDDANPEGMEEI